jgi:hypothetical protein
LWILKEKKKQKKKSSSNSSFSLLILKANLKDYATQAGFAYFFDKVAHQALGMEKK